MSEETAPRQGLRQSPYEDVCQSGTTPARTKLHLRWPWRSFGSSPPATLQSVPPETPEHLKAFIDKFQPCPKAEYGWVLSHAEKALAAISRNSDIVDTKATQLITFLGTAVSVSVAFSGTAIKATGWVTVACAAPAILCALIAVSYAAQAINPRRHIAMPTVRKAVECAECDEWEQDAEAGRGFFARLMHQSVEAEAVIVAGKATDLNLGFRFAVRALWALLLPLAVAVGTAALHRP